MRLLSFTLATLSAAYAAEVVPVPPESDPQTITVTADRAENTLERTTASATNVDAKDRERQGHPNDYTRTLQRVPAVDVLHRGGGLTSGGDTGVRLRGTQKNSDNQVLIDGIPWNDPTAVEGNPKLLVLQPASLDRIEVVRGPQSGLYGSRAVGGVVNLISRKPTSEHHGSVRPEAGSFRTRSLDVEAHGPLAGARGADEAPLLGYAIGSATLASDGFSAQTLHRDGNPDGHEPDAVRRSSLNGRVELAPDQDTTVYVAGWLARASHEYDNSPDDSQALARDRQWRAATGGSLRLPADGRLEVDLAYTRLDRHQRDSFTDARFEADDRYASVRYGAPLTPWLRGTIGVDYDRQEADYSAAPGRDQRIVGGWAKAEVRVDEYEGSLVGRHDEHSEAADADTFRIGAAWLPLDGRLKLHAAAGSGFRAPSIDELYAAYDFPGFPPFSIDYEFRGNPDLRPQRSLGWEAGVAAEPVDDVRVGSTFFVLGYRNRIAVSDAGSDATTTRQTLANEQSASRVHGVENEAGYRPTGLPWSGRVVHTWQDTRNEAGNPFVGAPRHKGSLETTYDIRWGWATASLDAIGNRRDVDGTRLGGYATLGAVVGWRIHPAVDIYLRGENLLDKAHTDAAAFGGAYYTGMPRAIFVGAVGRY